jgi:hypothetical protein
MRSRPAWISGEIGGGVGRCWSRKRKEKLMQNLKHLKKWETHLALNSETFFISLIFNVDYLIMGLKEFELFMGKLMGVKMERWNHFFSRATSKTEFPRKTSLEFVCSLCQKHEKHFIKLFQISLSINLHFPMLETFYQKHKFSPRRLEFHRSSFLSAPRYLMDCRRWRPSSIHFPPRWCCFRFRSFTKTKQHSRECPNNLTILSLTEFCSFRQFPAVCRIEWLEPKSKFLCRCSVLSSAGEAGCD